MNEVKNKVDLASFGQKVAKILKDIKKSLRKWHRQNMRSLTKFLDPRLEKYRTHAKEPVNSEPEKPQLVIPQTTEELITILAEAPNNVLNAKERQIIAAAMSFGDTTVRQIMLPEDEIIYVSADETLGPLVLDRLYHSGFEHFPVRDSADKLLGLVHTYDLNQLTDKNTQNVRDVVDTQVYYIRDIYVLPQALAAFFRTGASFVLVVNGRGQIVGVLTFQMLLEFILGKLPEDDFEKDDDKMAVARR